MSFDLHLGKLGQSSSCARVELLSKFAKVKINIQFSTWSREAYLGWDEPNSDAPSQTKFVCQEGRKMSRTVMADRRGRAEVLGFALCCQSGVLLQHS